MKQKNTLNTKKLPVFLGILSAVLLIFLAFFSLRMQKGTADTVITNLRVCHLTNPLGIDEEAPAFSWQMDSSERGKSQTAYRITLAENKAALTSENYYWDSGLITAGESVGIPYTGPALSPKTRYYWQVFVWDEKEEMLSSSEDAFFETGLMGEGMGAAKWISAPANTSSQISAYASDAFFSEALSYDINYQLEVSGTTAGLIFGAKEGRYGSLYLCEITNNDEQAIFRLHRMENGAFVSETGEELDITAYKKEDGSLFDITLSVNDSALHVTVNGHAVGSFVIEPTSVGSIGYYKSRGVSYAYMDNLHVTDAEGNILYTEDFEKESNIFSPYYVVTENGRLKIGSGLMLTPGYEAPAPLFRREFTLQEKPVKSARLYMTALGSFSLSLNGNPVSEDYFSPGKLAFNRRLSYMTYDVTTLLTSGATNALGITLLHGWYDRAVGYPEIWNPWGDKNALLGKLEIVYEDGTTEEIVTDSSFLCNIDGPVRSDDIYQGEFYDARLEKSGYDMPGYQAEGWINACENEIDLSYLSLPLTAKENEPIVCVKELTPLSVSEPLENVFVYDFGQNFAGTCQIHVTGKEGQLLTLRYGEHINTEALRNKDDAVGCIWTENLLTAEATDYYILNGNPEGETFSPKHTFHGFRYLQITGIEEAIPVEDIKGLVLSSDLEQTGTFTSSNELLNGFFQNTINSQQSNFMDNPTDCPQRDERHGWAGDAQVYSLTASYHMNTYSFYRKFLQDMCLIQTDAGSFTDMAPRNFGTEWDGRKGAATNNCWGDAPVVITWNLYAQYGDKAIIEENYEALCKWMEVLVNTSDNYIRYWGGYGDHLALESTPTDLSDTAWCAHSADLLSKMALVLGKAEDAAFYQTVYENYKQAWQNQYVLADGMTICHTQTSYALGLAFSLFPTELEEAAVSHLINTIETSGYHILSGFSGIGYLLPVLSEYGHADVAYKLLLQEASPSLLYPVSRGATSIWEQWTGMRDNEDGSYTLDGSFNHYTYGTPAGFLYTDILGIQSDETVPGYKHILLKPQTNEALSFAKGSYESIYGTIRSEWELTESGYAYTFEIPANTTATLTLPTLPEGKQYLEGKKTAENAKGVTHLETTAAGTIYDLSSGTYYFTVSK